MMEIKTMTLFKKFQSHCRYKQYVGFSDGFAIDCGLKPVVVTDVKIYKTYTVTTYAGRGCEQKTCPKYNKKRG